MVKKHRRIGSPATDQTAGLSLAPTPLPAVLSEARYTCCTLRIQRAPYRVQADIHRYPISKLRVRANDPPAQISYLKELDFVASAGRLAFFVFFYSDFILILLLPSYLPLESFFFLSHLSHLSLPSSSTPLCSPVYIRHRLRHHSSLQYPAAPPIRALPRTAPPVPASYISCAAGSFSVRLL
ncbi:hypothetical protein P170DRAFT_33023 [Aspergillus steynii IBT 23096]|uniref:Uncharacterized protein n=1 Tax=Aspergillus steynii IBT 23096 TaxID=1392250 RepID=A0A2I2GQH9_9EURO|nr:uncharacterized protein P170DRAFT_33023 [Aspergillus steynii IBT 23096]PLB55130.1 hypothetical protein P170DRAFT_33023 [Aspergillus steynii IBT 23096]